ncbi:hypothetical protein [Siminovitchia sp. 179-K 8D1 HS]|uniref:hypothetical protein n=1 Tax=Siminovitchia sp. 179-K 8D1 HS TaxID=3142385 RepID=UPI00399F6535
MSKIQWWAEAGRHPGGALSSNEIFNLYIKLKKEEQAVISNNHLLFFFHHFLQTAIATKPF